MLYLTVCLRESLFAEKARRQASRPLRTVGAKLILNVDLIDIIIRNNGKKGKEEEGRKRRSFYIFFLGFIIINRDYS